MPRNISTGVYSKPSGTTAVTGTVIDPTAWNNLTTDIGNEITNSLPRDGSAGMNAQLKALDGTTGAPGISFSSEVNTGIYRKGAGTLAASIGSTDVLVLNSTGIIALPAVNGGPLESFRNQLINGDFRFWQRGVTQSTNGYGSDDRWNNGNTGTTKVVTQQSHTVGQTTVLGNPVYFSRTVVTSVAGASNFCTKTQKIENVYTLQGQTATLTFWAKAASSQNMAVEFVQSFGSGGSPSADVTGIGVTTIALTTNWTRYDVLVALPSITGKTIGSNGPTFSSLNVVFWFDAGSSFNARTNSLGQQSGTFDISHASLVQGDARTETDPFSPRHVQQELALCQRYYAGAINFRFTVFANTGNGTEYSLALPVPMRAAPVINYTTNTSTNCSAALINTPTINNVNVSATAAASAPIIFNGTFTVDAEL